MPIKFYLHPVSPVPSQVFPSQYKIYHRRLLTFPRPSLHHLQPYQSYQVSSSALRHLKVIDRTDGPHSIIRARVKLSTRYGHKSWPHIDLCLCLHNATWHYLHLSSSPAILCLCPIAPKLLPHRDQILNSFDFPESKMTLPFAQLASNLLPWPSSSPPSRAGSSRSPCPLALPQDETPTSHHGPSSPDHPAWSCT